jgi:hypothetical protein
MQDMGSKQGARRPWTVLAYTVADDKGGGNSLDASAQKELRSILHAADLFGDVSVAAQVDFKRSPPGVFRGVVARTLRKRRSHDGFEPVRNNSHTLWGGIEARLERTRLKVLKEKVDLNAARSNVLRNFLLFGSQECPAERYVVFFYGHGYGPLGVFCDADSSGTNEKTMQLGGIADSVEALGGRAAVIVFRACNVNTLETAYQLKNAAKYMIASQSVVPIAGIWPWDTFLTGLLPHADSGDVAQSIARQLALFLRKPAHREPYTVDVPFTLIDLEQANTIKRPLKALAKELVSARNVPARARAAAYSRALEAARVGLPNVHSNPGDPALVDVPTMCENLRRLTRFPAAGPARELGEAVRRLVRWHSTPQGRHHGVGLFYRPVRQTQLDASHIFSEGTRAGDDRHYRNLALSKDTGWDRVALDPFPLD